MTREDAMVLLQKHSEAGGFEWNSRELDVITAAILEAATEPVKIAVRALKLIEHATAPGNDGGYHENAYSIAHRALSDLKWGTVDGAIAAKPSAEG